MRSSFLASDFSDIDWSNKDIDSVSPHFASFPNQLGQQFATPIHTATNNWSRYNDIKVSNKKLIAHKWAKYQVYKDYLNNSFYGNFRNEIPNKNPLLLTNGIKSTSE